MTFFQAQQWAFSYVDEYQKDHEAVDLLLLGQMNWSLTDLLMNYQTEMTTSELSLFQENIKKYCQDYPAQYLLKKASFFGRDFLTNEATLIPRYETEELVEWILDDHAGEVLKVADIGTGTGAIGLTLKCERPGWQVTITDIASETMAVAQANAQQLAIDITSVVGDLFTPLKDKYDVIVSNPPYISEEEKCYMDQSTLQYEPERALFAKEDGLYFYRRIAQEIKPYLNPQGELYLEFGFQQGPALIALFEKYHPTAQITLKKDINGHDRMLKVKFM
ncbi:peptide release factor-glutamine N5-methyltransferase [Ligilactobacillus ceti DSM 22408]|uniref:Release factor glutamine methyltransferase n=2 Tax=Ligilactobacillus TaxID=2767887 RepID=A0A0R2KNN2_9LACO|nr:peptide release factor-glutamine N5-methyltransferase [Ligilactobacillus ceti DSM 22408]